MGTAMNVLVEIYIMLYFFQRVGNQVRGSYCYGQRKYTCNKKLYSSDEISLTGKAKTNGDHRGWLVAQSRVEFVC